MRILFSLLLLPILLTAKPVQKMFNDPAIEEMRIDLEDVKYILKTTQVELNLLDEQLKKKRTPSETASLEKRISQLEKTIEKALSDVRAIHTQSTQLLTKLQAIEQQTLAHEKKLEEVVKLKTTLTQISTAIGQQPSTATYHVKAGDSLEKIARTQNTTVESLKKLNKLSHDRIFIGQELKLRE